jgi:hypothetical protein
MYTYIYMYRRKQDQLSAELTACPITYVMDTLKIYEYTYVHLHIHAFKSIHINI